MRKKTKIQITLIVIAVLALGVFLVPYVYNKLVYEPQHATPAADQ